VAGVFKVKTKQSFKKSIIRCGVGIPKKA